MEKTKTHSQIRYSSFICIKVDEKFRHLISNEKIAVKQELENVVGSCQEEVFLRTYSLVGLSSKCEMLLWLVSPDINGIQHTWARISTTGAGKYFSAAMCFLGLYTAPETAKKETACGGIAKNSFGMARYMVMHPVVRTHTWYELSDAERQKFIAERASALAKHPSVSEHVFHSYGIDAQESIVVREADKLEDLAAASKELREQRIKMFTARDYPNMLCVGTDLRDILDSLG